MSTWSRGSSAPLRVSTSLASDAVRSVSNGSVPGPVLYQREIESMPPGSSRSKNVSQASTV